MDLDDEVRLRVLEERVHSCDRSIRDVEKCCGSLRGDSNRLGERVVVLEHDVNTHCLSIKNDVKNVVTQTTEDSVLVDNLRDEVGILRTRLWAVFIVALSAVVADVLSYLH